jgi:outer membrane porin, OprD family
MIKNVTALSAAITIGFSARAQHQEMPGTLALSKEKQQLKEDTTSLLNAFKKGRISGHFRYFFMATDNSGALSDYYSNAIGGGIKYETAPLKGFQFGVSGFFIFNIGSSDLSKPDPKTNQANRYEIGLFDVEDPSNKNDINRLEELYLKYNWKRSHITFGKQLINTPFINLQDGRMRPTGVSGLYGEINPNKQTKIEGGYLYQLSPRSTVKWYNTGESIGLYPSGVNSDGTKSGYTGNLESKGIAMLGITQKFSKKFSIKAWDVFVENIFNSALLQADFDYPLESHGNMVASFQYIRQDAVKDGGNEEPAMTYFEKGSHSQAFGAKLGWQNQRWQTSLNYTRITADGRYLMPREWGRDPFFTFLPRERNEGFGDVNAYVVGAGYSIPKAQLKLQAGIGYCDLPDVTNFALNKYGMPSYTQLNMDIQHEFSGFFKGLRAQLLFVYKGRSGNTYENDKYVINKVDMSSWNLVFNYQF